MSDFKFQRNQKVKLNLCGKQYIGYIYRLDRRWSNLDNKEVNIYHFTNRTNNSRLHDGKDYIDWNFEESLFEELPHGPTA